LKDGIWTPNTYLPERQLNLMELACLIGHSSLLIGIDSAPTHLAVGLGIPSITFFKDFTPQVFSYFDRPAFHFDVDETGVFPLDAVMELSDILLARKNWMGRYNLHDAEVVAYAKRITAMANAAIGSSNPLTVMIVERGFSELFETLHSKSDSPLLDVFAEELGKIRHACSQGRTKEAMYMIRMSNYYKLVCWLARFDSQN
jgi:hypothetical protein